MKALDDLRAKYPLVFELQEKLVQDIAETEAAFLAKRERLSEEGQREAYSEMRRSLEPMRAQLDAVNHRIADVVAIYPPDGILIAEGHAVPWPNEKDWCG